MRCDLQQYTACSGLCGALVRQSRSRCPRCRSLPAVGGGPHRLTSGESPNRGWAPTERRTRLPIARSSSAADRSSHPSSQIRLSQLHGHHGPPARRPGRTPPAARRQTGPPRRARRGPRRRLCPKHPTQLHPGNRNHQHDRERQPPRTRGGRAQPAADRGSRAGQLEQLGEHVLTAAVAMPHRAGLAR